MEHLTFEDTQKLLQAIEQLYSIQDLSAFPIVSLEIVDRLVPSDMPIFHHTQFQSHQISYTVLPGYQGLTPEMKAVPTQHWGEHPISEHMPDTLYGAYKISDFISTAELHRQEALYHRFMRVRGWEDMMTIFLPPAPPEHWGEFFNSDLTVAGVALARTQRDFTERDRLILNLLRPHLLQAFNNARHYRSLRQDVTQVRRDLDGLGLIIIDTLGQIQLITSVAIDLLQTYFPNATTTRYLPELLWAWVKHQVAIRNSSNPLQQRLPLRIELDGRQLTIRSIAAPDEDRYLLLLEEQALALFPRLELLGLSPRETEVLYLVMRGETNNAIAKQLGVNVSTVRKHLERIFAKLNVQSRTEAISEALSRLGFFSSTSLG